MPGVAKTLLAKLTAKTLDCEFSRIQFTTDLMPSDILGTSILNMKTSEFEFRKGPIFSNFILIDEINRAPAKTQAALFEVMEERQVTTDNHTYKMGYPLFIIATQNPIDQEGTYKLPEAQLDRILFKLKLGYPSLEDETKILERFKNDFGQKKVNDINTVLSVDNLKKCSEIVESLHRNLKILQNRKDPTLVALVQKQNESDLEKATGKFEEPKYYGGLNPRNNSRYTNSFNTREDTEVNTGFNPLKNYDYYSVNSSEDRRDTRPTEYTWSEPKVKEPGADYKPGKFKFLDEAISKAKK